MSDELVHRDRDDRGVVRVTLNRPDKRNAFGAEMMSAIRHAVDEIAGDDAVRVLVITGAGSAFSAGADLSWMRSMVDYSYEENVEDSRRLDALFRSIAGFPRPVVAKVNGHALGGATGLIAAADIAVAARGAKIGFTEARLGLAPAVISTYVQPKIGVSNARRYFLTGEIFDADRALQIGLVHEVCDREELDEVTDGIIDDLLGAGPQAQAAIKELIPQIAAAESYDEAAEHTVSVIARLRVSDEGQEGMSAFFDKRPPAWSPDATTPNGGR